MSREPSFMETKDMADRVAVALVAIVNGDNAGAAGVLDGLQLDQVQTAFGSLLTLCAQFGCMALGPQAFVAALAEWRDAMATLPPDWLEKQQHGQ